MKLVGEKYLKFTQQLRQMHHHMHMGHIKGIMKNQKSGMHFEKQFPPYPIQNIWQYKDMPLHSYTWQPSSATPEPPKAVLINFNALNAHTGLSGKMAEELASSGIITTGIDYPNFGKSHSPNPGHIESVKHLVEISQSYLENVIARYPGMPVFLNGVSMGGLIAFEVGLRRPTLVNGCILLNPAFKDNPVNNGFLKKIMMLGGLLFPKFQTIKPVRSHSTKHSLQKYKHTDKLMYSGKVWTSTTWALLSHMRRIAQDEHFSEFSVPFLCIQGGSDKILNPFTVFQLERQSKSKDKEIVVIPDLWHAFWFDDHHDEVVEMIRNWILHRVDGKVDDNVEKNEKKAKHEEIGRHVHHHGHSDHHKNPQNLSQTTMSPSDPNSKN